MSIRTDVLSFLRDGHPGVTARDAGDRLYVEVAPEADIAAALVSEHDCEFASLVVEEANANLGFELRYFFYVPDDTTLIEIVTKVAPGVSLPAISHRVHAADWHEREAEDLFGIHFAGHPFLGDFVLHDTLWPEGVAPMRQRFDARKRVSEPGLGAGWKPRRVLEEEGALVLPIGPIWGDYHEAGLWLLETPGEQIRQASSRLFYKYRAVEKIAEGQMPMQALLLAERFSGNSAFAHAFAYCQALEKIAGCAVPARAQALRRVFAELERLRYHAASIAELAGSTALSVGKAMSQEIEERLLRLTGEVCGHRYLFGLCVPGGLAWEPDDNLLARLRTGVKDISKASAELERMLIYTSSFLDRIEEMGTLTPEQAELYGVVGPVARASGRSLDLRHSLPYGGYDAWPMQVPQEIEGDGYARLRVFFAEIRNSTAMIEAQLADLPDGPIAIDCPAQTGAAIAWAEAPAGGTFHWLRLDENGRVARWRIATPGFRNWHAFHRAVEGAAFQDFPIILASFGLSVAENDR
ncbi:MAG: NADH-quinone oxidoreductase subunit C [Gammaproteobacteria bacterium]